MIIELQPIGIIHSPFHSKEECPIQPRYAAQSRGTVEVFQEHQAGLKDIDTFSHIYLLFHLHQAGEIRYVRPTFLDDTPRGIYASRHPCRPNGIGLSIVKLIGRSENILDVEGIDTLDKTPLLDIKPYIPRHDHIEDATEGWLTGVKFREKPGGCE